MPANRYFREVMRAYLDSIEGEAERIASELDIDPASVSGWKKRRSAGRANFVRLLAVVKPDWRDKIRDAWLRDRTPPEVWEELDLYRAASAQSRLPVASRVAAGAIEECFKDNREALTIFGGAMARLSDVVKHDPHAAEFVASLFDTISGRRQRVMSPSKPAATPNPGEVA